VELALVLILVGLAVDLLVIVRLAGAYRDLRRREKAARPPKASKILMMRKSTNDASD
jgi:hypothetical protein